MRPTQRTALRQLYNLRCGYCGVSEVDIGAELTADHFQPRSRGGTDDIENLVYCCHACNEYKGDTGPSDSVYRILHPLRDILSQHLVERDDGTLQPLTATGAFHLEQLRLNRPALIAHRCADRELQAEREELLSLRQRLATLRKEEEELKEREQDL